MRIGITQNVQFVKDYAEVRDCLDQRWYKLLETFSPTIIPIPNTLKNIDEWLETLKCDAYVLTGGNDLSFLSKGKNVSIQRDRTEIALLKHAQANFLPVLGVCRGLQLINIFFGGQLQRVPGHVATRHSIRMSFDLKRQLIRRNVNSFHNWGIPKVCLSHNLTPCAYDDDGNIEAVRHEKLNWLGMMWHPEREENFEKSDLEMLWKLFNEGFE